MALHQVAELKAGVQGLLQNINLSKVVNLNGALERAARTVVQQADVPEASGMQPITLYDGVYYYEAPDILFGGAINLIRRQGEASSPLDYNYKVPVDTFTRTKQFLPNGYMIDVEYKNGTAMLGISSPIPKPRIIIDPMNDTTGWVAAGSASGLVEDETVYYQQPASLRMTLTGSSTGTLTKTLQSPLDLTAYEGVGIVFLAIYTPSAADFTSATVRLGSDSSNYFETGAETEGFLGAWTANDWTLIALDLSSATETGTVDIENVEYVQVRLAHTATLVNFRVGYLWTSLPMPNEILFQSSAIFRTTAGLQSQTITSDGDTIILNDAAYTLLEYEAALNVAMQQGGDLSSGQVQMFRGILYGSANDQGMYNLYRGDNPSAELRTVGSYYNPW